MNKDIERHLSQENASILYQVRVSQLMNPGDQVPLILQLPTTESLSEIKSGKVKDLKGFELLTVKYSGDN
jgi:hypothetical protein